MIIRNGDEFKVIGSGMVVLYDPSQLMHNNSKILEPGTPMTITNLVVSILADGDEFKLRERTFNIPPLESYVP